MKQQILKYYQHYMYLMGFAGHFVFVLQAFKIWQTKCSSDVSLSAFFVCFWATCSWFLYGLLIDNPVLIRVNIFGIIAGVVCLGMIMAYGS